MIIIQNHHNNMDIAELKNKPVTEILYECRNILHDVIKAHLSWTSSIHIRESELLMTETISGVYSDDPFPHVLIYSMLLTILSLAAVGLVSSHVPT